MILSRIDIASTDKNNFRRRIILITKLLLNRLRNDLIKGMVVVGNANPRSLLPFFFFFFSLFLEQPFNVFWGQGNRFASKLGYIFPVRCSAGEIVSLSRWNSNALVNSTFRSNFSISRAKLFRPAKFRFSLWKRLLVAVRRNGRRGGWCGEKVF